MRSLIRIRIQTILYSAAVAASCIEGGLVLVAAFASSSSSSSGVVPRITLDEFISSPIRNEPIIIRDIASPEQIEALADELMSLLGEEQIKMQHKVKHDDNGETTTDIYDISLHESIDYMMDSKHDDSFFAFCEGLLPSDATVKLHQKLTEIRESPFPNEENWFNYFPEKVRPTDALILAGEGATSTLHRDPFEWTGTSLCIEGVKVWRFILPTGGVTNVDEALKSYRLDSIAWEDDEAATEENQQDPLILSAGWQSNMNLYNSVDEEFPTAIDWATLEEENYKLFRKEIISLGSDASLLRPSSEATNALKSISGNNIPFVTATQFAGDLLIIPAHCWHQTYAPTPSIAVASQRCGVSDGAKVVQHVLNLNDSKPLPDLLQRNNAYEEGIGKQVITELLSYILGSNVAKNKA